MAEAEVIIFSNIETPIDINLIFRKMGLHPLDAISADLKGCVSLDCRKDLGQAFIDDVARATVEAVDAIARYLGYTPYIKQETECLAYPYEEGCACPMLQQRTDKYKSVRLRNNYFLKAGRLTNQLVQSGLPVTYHDLDGDGLREVARVTFNLTDTDCLPEYQLFYESHRIRPIKRTTVVGTQVTLEYDFWDMLLPNSGPSLVAVLRKEIERPDMCCDFNAQDEVDDPSCDLVRTVDLRRIFVDENECPATLQYEGGLDKCGCGKPSCIAVNAPACLQRTGLCNVVRLLPATEGVDGCVAEKVCGCRREPDIATIHYLGGCPDCEFSCYNAENVCHFDAIYWLTLAWVDYTQCNCNTELWEIANAQKDSEKFDSGDRWGYDGIVRNNLVGERKAWGLLTDELRLGQLCG